MRKTNTTGRLPKDRLTAQKVENESLAVKKFVPRDRHYFLKLKSENVDLSTCYLYACALGITFNKESAAKGVDNYLQSNGMKMIDLGSDMDICVMKKYSDCIANDIFIHIEGTTKEGVSMSIPLASLDADRGVFVTALGKKYSPNFFQTLAAKVFHRESVILENYLQFQKER